MKSVAEMKLIAEFRVPQLLAENAIGYLKYYLRLADKKSTYTPVPSMETGSFKLLLLKQTADKTVIAFGYDVNVGIWFTDMTNSPLTLKTGVIDKLKPIPAPLLEGDAKKMFTDDVQNSLLGLLKNLCFIPPALSEAYRPKLLDRSISNKSNFISPQTGQSVEDYFVDLLAKKPGLGFLEKHTDLNVPFFEQLMPILARHSVKHLYLELPFKWLWVFECFNDRNSGSGGDLSVISNYGNALSNLKQISGIMKAAYDSGILVFPIDRSYETAAVKDMSSEQLLQFFVADRNKVMEGSIRYFSKDLPPTKKYVCLLGVGHHEVLGNQGLNIPSVILNNANVAKINRTDELEELNQKIMVGQITQTTQGSMDETAPTDLEKLYGENFYLDVTKATDPNYLSRTVESVVKYKQVPSWLLRKADLATQGNPDINDLPIKQEFSMTTFILSLGTLVDTKAERSIAKFVEIATKQDKMVDVKTVVLALQSSFAKFNFNAISQDELKAELETALDISMTNEEFLNAWNPMCQVTDETREIIRFIQEVQQQSQQEMSKPVFIDICADTNKTHLSHIESQLVLTNLSLPKVQTTFEHRMPKAELLKTLIQKRQVESSGESIVVVIGNTDKIAEAAIAEIVNKRDEDILAITSVEPNVQCVKLAGASLTKNELLDIITVHSRTFAEDVISKLNTLNINTSSTMPTEAHSGDSQSSSPTLQFTSTTLDPFLPVVETPSISSNTSVSMKSTANNQSD